MSIKLTRMLGSPLLLLLTLAVATTTAELPHENHVLESHSPLSMGNDHHHHHPSDGGMQFDSEEGPHPDTQEPHHVFFPIHESQRRLSLGDIVGLVFHLGDAINDFRAAHTTVTVTPGQSKNDSTPSNASVSMASMTHHMSTLGPELKPLAAKNSSNSTQTPAVSFVTPEINLTNTVAHAPGSLHHTSSAAPVFAPSHAA